MANAAWISAPWEQGRRIGPYFGPCMVGRLAPLCAILFACGPNVAVGPGGGDSGPVPGCSESCLFQYRDIDTCYEGAGPMVDDGPWLDNCVDDACENLSLNPTSELNPLVPCVTGREYRDIQTHLGPCNGSHLSTTLREGGASGGKSVGALCADDPACVSGSCASFDGQNFVCADPCSGTNCPEGFACVAGYCFPSCLRP